MVILKSKAGYSAYIFLIMALSLNMMYLLPSDFHLGSLTLRLISIIVNFGFYFLVVCKCGVSNKIKKIDGWFLTAIILVIIGTITAYFTYNQPIFSTFLIQMYIFSYTILFVPIRKLIDQGILSGNSIKRIVYVFGITLLALFLLQYFLQDKLLFLQVTKIERYGGSRFYLDSAYLALLVAIAFSEIVKKKTIVLNLLIIVATVFVEMSMIKSRAIMAAFIASAIISVLIVKQASWKKIIIGCICVFIGYYFFTYTTMGIDILNSVVEADTSLNIRSMARTFYINKFLQNPIFGCGYVDSYYNYSAQLSGQTQGFYYVDNGIWGIMFYYGIVGLLWSAIGIIPRMIQAVKLARKSQDTFSIFYLVYIIALMNTVQFDFFRALLSFTLFAILLYCLVGTMDELIVGEEKYGDRK